MKLCTVEDVKRFLDMKAGETRWDSMLDTDVIPGVSRQIEKHLRRSLEDTGVAAAEVFSLIDSKATVIALDRYPVTSITSVWEDSDEDWVDDTLLEAATDYTHDPDMGLLYRKTSYWLRGLRTVRVLYRGGYTVAADGALAVPDDLRLAVVEQVAHVWQRKGLLGSTAVSQGAAQTTYTRELGLLADVKDKLSGYRRMLL